MTALSIISILLLAVMIIVFALCLKKKEGRLALRSASACGQLVVVMTVVLSVFLMAQDSVIYNNSLTGLYDAEGIDLFYMSKAAGIISLIALIATGLCFMGSLAKSKSALIFIPAPLAVIGGTVLALWLLTKYAPHDYYATLVPAVMLVGWCLLVLAVNTTFDCGRLWCKIVVIVINTLNFAVFAVAVVSVALMANAVAQDLEDMQSIMIAVLAVVLLIAALPSVINFVAAILDTACAVKEGVRKARQGDI